MEQIRSTVGLALVLALSAACASAPTGEEQRMGTQPSVVVQVFNNQIPPTTITVSVVEPGAGEEALLGTVAPNQTESFSYDPADFRSGTFQLRATGTSGEEILSEPFTLAAATAVEWDIVNNDVNVISTP